MRDRNDMPSRSGIRRRGRRGAATAALACALLLFAPGPAPADELILAADAWCPFSCEPGSDYPGFIVELARQAFATEGHEVTYVVVPWARAIEGARAGNYTAIMGALKVEVPDFVFPEKEAAVISEQCYVLEGSPLRYENPESLRDLRLGVIRDYSYGPDMDDYLAAHAGDDERIFVATGEEPLLRLVRMLEHGRIDVLIESVGVMNSLAMGDVRVPGMRPAGIVNEEPVYIAFAPGRAESAVYAGIFDRAVEEMAASGALAALKEKYGINNP